MNTQKKQELSAELIESLIGLAVEGLNDFFIPETLDFAEKKSLIDGKIVKTGTNLRYNLINLMGLFKAQSHESNIKINLKKVLLKHISDVENYKGIGEIGLLLWAASLISPSDINKILTKFNFDNLLDKYPDSQSKLTMELSWFLTGLLMASTFNETFKVSIGELPQKVYKLIRNNYGGHGIFRHQDNKGIFGKLRGGLASFADQVYPIYAFSLYSQQKHNEEAMLIAEECANKICEHQGEYGEWPWHYDAENGNVISTYPVYSVHQDAMAPMALYAIQKASNTNFEDHIFKGLFWLVHQKNSQFNMISYEHKLIWRAVAPRKTGRKIKSTLAHLGFIRYDKYTNLELVEESWSYHLGWLLYAFAGRIDDIADRKSRPKKSTATVKIYRFGNN